MHTIQTTYSVKRIDMETLQVIWNLGGSVRPAGDTSVNVMASTEQHAKIREALPTALELVTESQEGWHPVEGSGGKQERFHDGTDWTDQFRDVE